MHGSESAVWSNMASHFLIHSDSQKHVYHEKYISTDKIHFTWHWESAVEKLNLIQVETL